MYITVVFLYIYIYLVPWNVIGSPDLAAADEEIGGTLLWFFPGGKLALYDYNIYNDRICHFVANITLKIGV